MVWVGAGERPGVVPVTPWSCPDTHPIKGYVSAESGARVYYVPGGRFYEEASPERCYATDEEARRDGSRPAREPRAPAIPHADDLTAQKLTQGLPSDRNSTSLAPPTMLAPPIKFLSSSLRFLKHGEHT